MLVDVQVGIVDALVVVVRALEDDRAALEDPLVPRLAQVALAELLGDHAHLDDSEVEEVPGEHLETGLLLQRLVVGRDHLGVVALPARDLLGPPPPRDRRRLPPRAPRPPPAPARRGA